MPCLCRMSKISVLGLIWLYIFSTGLYVASLEPGYLDFDNLPDTNFSCVGKVIGGYYADLEANCQMFHVCTIGQLDEPMDIRFLCLNGTVFDQETRVCERIDEVDCSKSEKFYSLNLELYGNTQPPILEEDADTESPPMEKSTLPTTTTTTTTTTPRPRTTTTTKSPQYFSSSIRTVMPSSYHKIPPSHHFPIGEQHHSHQYTPEEINISLNPGAPPDIRTKSPQFRLRSYSDNVNSDNKKIVVTTDSSVFRSDDANRKPVANRLHFSSTTERNNINYDNIQTQQPNNQFNFNFNYHDVDSQEISSPRPHNYHYQNNIANFRPPGLSGNSYSDNPFRSSTHRNEYLPVTRKNYEISRSTPTARSFFLQPIKSPSHQYFTRTEKPQGDDLPVPVLPTLAPIVFSSPAPFTLTRHRETKRFTDDHELPPRIIISASASVSDASGRTLNYSLGTIGAAQLLAQPPSSYDDYKEDDVVLDPFYHDVPKIRNQQKRSKRDTSSKEINSDKPLKVKRSPQNLRPSDIIKNEDEAIEVLKFLFDWYKSQEKTTKSVINSPVSPDEITDINKEFSRSSYSTEYYPDDATLERGATHGAGIQNSDLFNSNSKYNILGNLFDTSISRKAVAQEPVTKSYETFTDEKILYDQVNRPSAVYIENYEATKIPKFTQHFEQHERKNTENVYLHTTKTAYSNNRRKMFRGRHRFTVPYSSTEWDRTPSDRIYTRPTTANPSSENVLNAGFVYDIRDAYKTTPTQYRNTHEQRKTWNQLDKNIKNAYEEEHQDFIDSYPSTESSSTKILEEPFKQISTNQELLTHYTTKYEESNSSVATDETPSVEAYDENYTEQIVTVRSEQHNTDTESFYNITDVTPDSVTQTFELSSQTHSNSENISNVYVPTEKLETNLYQDKTNKSDDPELAFEELNRAESLKTSSQLQLQSTEDYGSFDVYDYVNDNYEPITYSEQPEKSFEEQLEKGEKDNGKEIVHEETHINVDFSESSQDVTSEESTSVRKTTIIKSSGDNFKESSKSQQETYSQGEVNRHSEVVNTPTFKYIDKNINSFADILKSLRDFQMYEQNIYDYNHNLIGIKEYGTQQNDNVDDEIGTTALPTTLESTTRKYELPNEINNETSTQDAEELTTVSNIGFTNKREENYELNHNEERYTDSTRYGDSITESQNEHILTTDAPGEEEQLYTSKPYENMNELKTNTLINLDHSESTKIFSLTPLETTIASVDRETLLPVDSTSLASNLDEITTAEPVTELPSTEKTNLKIKVNGRSRSRLKNRDNSRYRVRNQYNSSYKLSSSRNTEKMRKNRRRQQNKPHLPEVVSKTPETPASTTSETPASTILPKFDSTSEQKDLHSVLVTDIQPNEHGELDEVKSTTMHITEGSETIVPQHENSTDSSLNISTVNVIENTSTGFFITKQPKISYTETINENRSIGTEPLPKTSMFTTQETTETYTTYADNENTNDVYLKSDTTTMLNGNKDSTYSTPTTYVFIIKTTRNNQINEYADKDMNDYTSIVETTTTTSFAESDALSTTSTAFERFYHENETNDSITQMPTTLQDTTTTTSNDVFETLLTDMETTTNEALSTIHKDERYMDKYSSTSVYDSDIKLIRKIEEATNSTVVSETAQNISDEDISVNTTKQPNPENTTEVDIATEHSTETTDVPNIDIDVTTESLSTVFNEPNINSTYQPGHQITSNKYDSLPAIVTTTISPIEEDTKTALESTTQFPSTKIEIITQINTDNGVSTEMAIKSQYSSNKKASAKSGIEKYLENRKQKYNTRRTYQRLPKKKSPGQRKFSTRHRFSSNNVTPATVTTSYFNNDGEIHRHRFDVPLATPRPTGTTERYKGAIYEDEASMTDNPLPKNVKPTQGDSSTKIDLSTTPLSTLYKVQLRKERVNKQFIFNCFGKQLDAFYSDPRDCRLFHYCTKGYTRNQLLDMKFVCDFGTHFDEEKLVCTTETPDRCL